MLEIADAIVLPPAAAGVALSCPPIRFMFGVAAHRGCTLALGEALGVALPDTPRVVIRDGVAWLWSGVASWLALGDDPALPARLAGLAALAAVTAQSHGRTVLHVTGARAAEVLAKLVPIDLHPSAFAADATAVTLAGHIGVQIWRVPDGFALACLSSYGRALADALAEAMPSGEG